jgi:hypothetical protein
MATELAEMFPDATPLRLRVRVRALRSSAQPLEETTWIEYGTARELLFASTLPLEFEDRVRIENADGSFKAEAVVVAVQFHNGRKAVAARFLGEVTNWIIQP